MTDVLLLSLGCLFLYWSVKWPWQWYRQTQATVLLDSVLDDPFESSDEAEDDDGSRPNRTLETDHSGAAHPPVGDPSKAKRSSTANQNLRRFEVLALMSCFLSPVAVAYVLHALRPHLSRPSGGLVSNSNLTLFVLAAEVRPILHLCRLIERRTLYWQRMVSPSNAEGPAAGSSGLVEILERIESIELRQKSAPVEQEDGLNLSGTNQTNQPSGSGTDAADSLVADVKQVLQPQIDALNRAVRRYEKRSAAQAALLDVRLRHVDGRAADAMALAAAAMRDAAAVKKPRPKPPSLVGNLLGGALAAAGSVVGALVELVLLPWRLVAGACGYLFGLPGVLKSGRLRSDASGLSYGLRGKRPSLGRLAE
jgi:hypothetical protein